MGPSGGTFEIVGRVDGYVVSTSKAGNKYGKGSVVDSSGRRYDIVAFDEDAIGAIVPGSECTVRGELRPRRSPGGMMVIDLVVKAVEAPPAPKVDQDDPFA